ncbi:MAG: SDR family oxidoreductase [Methylomonas sp.]|nr:SDR family oxidoreductase [Methylomonas sp.]
MNTVLITGANRGLGLEFCKQYAEAGWKVLAVCREPSAALQLQALAERHDTLQIEQLDVGDFAGIDCLGARLASDSIDVLVNNAGVYLDHSGNGLGHLDYAAWSDSFLINSIAPVKLVETFLPHIQRSQKKLIVSISSLMGSMADNQSGGSLLYRSSKAGLNAAMKTLAVDLAPRAIGVLILHPGWVRTDMGGKNALIDVNESVSGMRKQIAEFTLAQSGCFVKYDGSRLPW